MASSPPSTRLPNAPLAEAVFEMRWAMVGDPTQPVFQVDPGAVPLLSRFTAAARGAGFGATLDVAQLHEIAGPSVLRRFSRSADQPFPLLQIGPGIFATNQSTEYHWPDFKAQALSGYDMLIESYPKFEDYPLLINRTELRYVDVFDTTLVDTADFIDFINRVTTWPVGLPEFVLKRKEQFEDIDGRIQLSSKIKNLEESWFGFDLAKGAREDETVFRLEIKIVQTFKTPIRATKLFSKKLDRWLEGAHEITSPFFKSLIQPSIMAKFEE